MEFLVSLICCFSLTEMVVGEILSSKTHTPNVSQFNLYTFIIAPDWFRIGEPLPFMGL